MQVRVLTDNFNLSAVLDKILYLKYTESFSEAGDIYMKIPFELEHYKKLKPPSRLLIGDLLYTVERLKCSNGEIEVYGNSIFDDFKHASITKPRTLEGKPSSMVYDLASEMSFNGVNYHVYGVSDIDDYIEEAIEWCTSYKSTISRICYEHDLGFRIVFDGMTRELKFIVNTIADKATASALRYTVISDKRDTFVDFESTVDISNYKTCIEFVYRINAIDDYDSIVYDKTPLDEIQRIHTESPHIIANTTAEFIKLLGTRVSEFFKSHRKIRGFKVRLRGEPKHIVGDLCYVENSALDECTYALLTTREVVFDGNEEYEELILEVR